ncbi:hypothetical protein B0H16DRAFT_1891395 [Mycena metata]|uniref:Uncharacterized protein n=1 Tax=Mycena metata TaxID=1033252 RepID=A0AAD7MZ31_9AGAR|nr:hypothetical protein B0H16DRAFT_1891395 [Mycena metata]
MLAPTANSEDAPFSAFIQRTNTHSSNEQTTRTLSRILRQCPPTAAHHPPIPTTAQCVQTDPAHGPATDHHTTLILGPVLPRPVRKRVHHGIQAVEWTAPTWSGTAVMAVISSSIKVGARRDHGQDPEQDQNEGSLHELRAIVVVVVARAPKLEFQSRGIPRARQAARARAVKSYPYPYLLSVSCYRRGAQRKGYPAVGAGTSSVVVSSDGGVATRRAAPDKPPAAVGLVVKEHPAPDKPPTAARARVGSCMGGGAGGGGRRTSAHRQSARNIESSRTEIAGIEGTPDKPPTAARDAGGGRTVLTYPQLAPSSSRA